MIIEKYWWISLRIAGSMVGRKLVSEHHLIYSALIIEPGEKDLQFQFRSSFAFVIDHLPGVYAPDPGIDIEIRTLSFEFQSTLTGQTEPLVDDLH